MAALFRHRSELICVTLAIILPKLDQNNSGLLVTGETAVVMLRLVCVCVCSVRSQEKLSAIF